MPIHEFPLSQLKQDEYGIVVRLEGDKPVLRRMIEMGLLPGTQIKLTRRAPLSDPIEIELRGYTLTLREDEAKQIYVKGGPVCRRLRW